MKKVIEEVGPQKAMAVCTDNATNMKKAWQILKHDYNHIVFYGCLVQSFNLIFTDLNKIKSVGSMMTECVSVVKHIRNSQKLSAMFKEIQHSSEASKKTTLKLPVQTRYVNILYF